MPPVFYYIDLESVKGGRLLDDKIVEAENAPSRAQRLLMPNDIIFQTVRPYQQNNYFYATERDLPTIASTGYAVIRTKQDPKFVYSLIHTQRFLTPVMLRCTGSSYPAVTGTDLEDIPTWMPSLEEQKRIGALLDLIGKKIDAQTKIIETLKKYKRGLVSSILSEKIKISDEPWEECTIGDFLASKSIKQLPTEEAPLMAFTATGGVCDKGERYDRGFLVKDASTKLYKRTDYGDFIYSSNNLDVGSIGLNLYGSAVISDVYEIFSINDADPWFISEVIQQKPIMSDILKYRQGCLYGQYRIYAEDFLSVKIRIPSLPLQSKIGALISQVESKILAEQGLLDNLEKCKAALFQMMFI